MRQPKLAKLQEVQNLAARAAPMFLEVIAVNRN